MIDATTDVMVRAADVLTKTVRKDVSIRKKADVLTKTVRKDVLIRK